MLQITDKGMTSYANFSDYSKYMCHGCGKDSQYDRGFPVIPAGLEFPVHLWRVHKTPYLDVNRMIFVWAGQTYHTNNAWDLVPTDFLSLLLSELVYMTKLN